MVIVIAAKVLQDFWLPLTSISFNIHSQQLSEMAAWATNAGSPLSNLCHSFMNVLPSQQARILSSPKSMIARIKVRTHNQPPENQTQLFELYLSVGPPLWSRLKYFRSYWMVAMKSGTDIVPRG